MIIDKNCIINGMPERVYHSDPTPELEGFAMSTSASSSVLKEITDYTEREAFLKIERFNPAHVKKSSKSADTGTIAHDYILKGGDGRGIYEILPFDDFRTKESQEMKKQCEARNLIALNSKTAPDIINTIEQMKNVLHDHFASHELQDLMLKGRGEQSAFYFDGTIWNRARFDWEDEKYQDIIVDYKTTGLSFDAWERNELWGSGQFLQNIHYRKVKQGITGVPQKLVFVVQQTFEPYLVDVFTLDESFSEETQARYDLGRLRLINCLRTGVWRGRTPYLKHSYPPAYILSKWEMDDTERQIAQKHEQELNVTMAG